MSFKKAPKPPNEKLDDKALSKVLKKLVKHWKPYLISPVKPKDFWVAYFKNMTLWGEYMIDHFAVDAMKHLPTQIRLNAKIELRVALKEEDSEYNDEVDWDKHSDPYDLPENPKDAETVRTCLENVGFYWAELYQVTENRHPKFWKAYFNNMKFWGEFVQRENFDINASSIPKISAIAVYQLQIINVSDEGDIIYAMAIDKANKEREDETEESPSRKRKRKVQTKKKPFKKKK